MVWTCGALLDEELAVEFVADELGPGVMLAAGDVTDDELVALVAADATALVMEDITESAM